MASAAIPVTKAVADKNNGIPDNGFDRFTGIGAAHDNVDYASIPKLVTTGQWLFVVPFRNKIKNKGVIAIPDSAMKKAESYLVIGSNDKLVVQAGDVVKIMDSAKRAISIEAALSPVFCGLDVFAIAPESVFWVIPDTYLEKLVL